jgi:hypothetical protein
MRKWLSGFACMFLVLLALPTIAQNHDGCSVGDITERIDNAVTEYKATRNETDAGEALNSAESLSDTIESITDGCSDVLATSTSNNDNTGTGSTTDPFKFNQYADDGTGILLKVSGIARPADQTIRNENRFNDRPNDGEEYVIIFVDIRCTSSRSDNCENNYLDFDLVGDNNVIYEYASVVYDDKLDINLRPGGEGSGSLPFLIESDDTNLQLAFHPSGYFSNEVIYYSAEPSAGDGVIILSTSSLNVRGGPSTNFGLVGSLQNGEEAIAFGRNEDGTWLQLIDGWVFTELVETSGDVMTLPITTE